MGMTTWRELISDEMENQGETWSDVCDSTLSKADLDRRFNSGFGREEGVAFTLWTKNHVYFPACYDGSEWAASVPRNPGGPPTSHIGG